MRKNTIFLKSVFITFALVLIFSLVMQVHASPFSGKVAGDYYAQMAGATVNGIPTAYTVPSTRSSGHPNIYEAINKIAGTNYNTNADVDWLFVDNDYLWKHTSGKVTIIGYSAFYQNTLGVKTASDSHDILTVDFNGQGFAPGFPTYDIDQNGVPGNNIFEWYLRSTQTNGDERETFYSVSSENPNGMDHTMTFDL